MSSIFAGRYQKVCLGSMMRNSRSLFINSLGLGCYIAWSFICWNGALFEAADTNFSGVGIPYAAQALSTACAAFVLAFAASQVFPLSGKRTLTLAFAICMAVSVPLISYANKWMLPFLMVIAFVISGVGSSLRLGWEEFLSLHGIEETAFCAAFGYAVGYLIFVVVLFLPSALLLFIGLVLPFVSVSLLLLQAKESTTLQSVIDEHENREQRSFVRSISQSDQWKLIIVVALVFFGYGLLRTSGIYGPFQAKHPQTPIMAGFPAIASMTAIFFAYVAFRKSVRTSFYIAVPLIAVAALLPTSLDPLQGGIAFCTLLVGSEMVKYTIWFSIIRMFQNQGFSLLLNLSLIRCAQWGGSAVGQFCTPYINNQEIIGIAVLISLIAALLLVMSMPNKAKEYRRDRTFDLEEKAKALSAQNHLTQREREVLLLWITGHEQSYVGRKLCISNSTVKTHLNHIYAKTSTSNREDLLQKIEGMDMEET